MTEGKIHTELQATIRYQQGKMNDTEAVTMFAWFISTGFAWRLPETYGEQAEALIEAGVIDAEGNIDQEAFDEALKS